MKKCSRYLDALDQNAAEDSALWQDLLVHAGKCPDCSTDMQFRALMLEKLAESGEPHYPSDLHQSLIAAVEDGAAGDGNEEQGLLERLFDKLLSPLEATVSLACVLMFVFLIQLNHESGSPSAAARPLQLAARRPGISAVDKPAPDTDSLEHVSSAEVKDFLAKLEEFRRAHPQEPSAGQVLTPEVELANYNQLWREP